MTDHQSTHHACAVAEVERLLEAMRLIRDRNKYASPVLQMLIVDDIAQEALDHE